MDCSSNSNKVYVELHKMIKWSGIIVRNSKRNGKQDEFAGLFMEKLNKGKLVVEL